MVCCAPVRSEQPQTQSACKTLFFSGALPCQFVRTKKDFGRSNKCAEQDWGQSNPVRHDFCRAWSVCRCMGVFSSASIAFLTHLARKQLHKDFRVKKHIKLPLWQV
jgi:hypothetical protein